ncbi:MAG: ABC transporter permease [Elusimicrobiota bacterium]
MRNFVILLAMELKKCRQGWVWSLLMASLFPLALLFFMKLSLTAQHPGMALYASSGILVMNIILNSAMVLGSELSQMKEAGALDYYCLLPLSRLSFVLALLARSVIFSLPSLVTLSFIGYLAFGINPLPHAGWLAPTLALAVLSLSGFGAWMGLAVSHPRMATLATQVFYLFVVFCSPVMVPEESLPRGLSLLASVLPTTYAASALRQLFEPMALGPAFFKDLAGLGAFSVFSITIVLKRLKWQTE